MAQVNSEAGKNQTFANVAVAVGPVQPGASQSRAIATTTTVTYMNVEPGTTTDTALKSKRS